MTKTINKQLLFKNVIKPNIDYIEDLLESKLPGKFFMNCEMSIYDIDNTRIIIYINRPWTLYIVIHIKYHYDYGPVPNEEIVFTFVRETLWLRGKMIIASTGPVHEVYNAKFKYYVRIKTKNLKIIEGLKEVINTISKLT